MSTTEATVVDNLLKLAETLRQAQRSGAEVDKPEGTRYITMSDTLAERIVTDLELAADTIKQLARLALRSSEVAVPFVVEGATTIQIEKES